MPESLRYVIHLAVSSLAVACASTTGHVRHDANEDSVNPAPTPVPKLHGAKLHIELARDHMQRSRARMAAGRHEAAAREAERAQRNARLAELLAERGSTDAVYDAYATDAAIRQAQGPAFPASAREAKAQARAEAVAQSLAPIVQIQEEARNITVKLAGSVRFRSGDAVLLPISRQNLERAVEVLKDIDGTIVVAGYTDSVGSRADNLKLSQARADNVREYLVEHGLDPSRVLAVGRGEDGPIASNGSPGGRGHNRRVGFELRPRTEPALLAS